MDQVDEGFGFSNTSRVCFEFGGPRVGQARLELWLPYTDTAGLNLGVPVWAWFLWRLEVQIWVDWT